MAVLWIIVRSGRVSQCFGRKFAEERAVSPGEAAKVPETKARGHLAHLRPVMSFPEGLPGTMESPELQVATWRHPENVVEYVPQRAVRNVYGFRERFDRHARDGRIFNQLRDLFDQLLPIDDRPA